MTNCQICKKKIKGKALTCSKGTICMQCSEDISLAETQPISTSNCILWCMAETFFRKGQGEDTNFEQVWRNGEGTNQMKLVKFVDLFNIK